MAGQLEHMAEVAERPNVDLAILPNSEPISSSSLNVFVAYDDRLVLVELFSGEVALRDNRDITYHLNVFQHFRERAVSGSDAKEILVSAAAEFMRTRD